MKSLKLRIKDSTILIDIVPFNIQRQRDVLDILNKWPSLLVLEFPKSLLPQNEISKFDSIPPNHGQAQ